LALGKGVVDCKDTPGFIGNRIGIYWLQVAVAEAFSRGVTVEQADELIARPMGIPKTGVFGLLDLIGIDLMPHVVKSMEATLTEGDAFFDYIEIPEPIQKMIANGYTGRKGKGGFYRLNKSADGSRVKESISLATGEYARSVRPRLTALDACRAAGREGSLRALVSHEDPMGEYAFAVLAKTLHYAASLVPEIADDIVAVDAAMRLGYNWEEGPFELIDRLGAEWFAGALEAKGMSAPALVTQAAGSGGFYRVKGGRRESLQVGGGYAALERPAGVLLLSDLKLGSKPVAKNGSASLWDLGDGVACLEVHTKMNAIDPDVMKMIHRTLTVVPKKFKALVIHNGADTFSVGVNLGLALYAANMAAWSEIEGLVKHGQDTYKALKYARFPVVGAPTGMALGGGCEILLHCDAVVAHAETYMGLVEVGVGVIPGWGGCKEMLLRWFANKKRPGGPMPAVGKAFETISTAAVSKSAAQARDYLFLRPHDRIVMNRDRVLAEAKAMALALAADYTPPQSPEIGLPGPSARAAMCMAVDGFHKQGKATDYDVVVSEGLAEVLSGGDTDITDTLTEDNLLALERKAFMALIRRGGTLSRMEHMLETGKPLRN
ncbi:MAG: 3-hydroxyacyl-CoA dehydrogenase family protein, partial [Gammaproteobacteria bacterium]